MYEDVTYEDILERMLGRVPSTLDKREGSLIYNALAPAAVELQLMYIELDTILNETFADKATREFLVRRCKERMIIPSEATNATLKGEFTPTNIDVTGQRFNVDDLNYIVTEKIADGVYQVQCETAGIIGNQYLGQLIPMENINGLETAELTDVLIPGEDEEDTESLRQRYFDSFDSQAFGGNRKDYLEKINGISGVGGTKLIRAWDGGGTVKAVILNSEFNAASSILVNLVQSGIDPKQDGNGDGLAPIDHIVTIVSAEELSITVRSTFDFSNGYSFEDLKSQIESAVSSYFLGLRKEWADQEHTIVRISQIESKLLSIQGIIDVTNTTLNGEGANLTLKFEEIPIFGGVADD